MMKLWIYENHICGLRSEESTAMIILHLIPSCFIDRPRNGQGYLPTIFFEKTEILFGKSIGSRKSVWKASEKRGLWFEKMQFFYSF